MVWRIKYFMSDKWRILLGVWVLGILLIVPGKDVTEVLTSHGDTIEPHGLVNSWYLYTMITIPLLGALYAAFHYYWFRSARIIFALSIPLIAFFGGLVVTNLARLRDAFRVDNELSMFWFLLSLGIGFLVITIYEDMKRRYMHRNRPSWVTEVHHNFMDSKYSCGQISLKTYRRILGYDPDIPSQKYVVGGEEGSSPYTPERWWDHMPDRFGMCCLSPHIKDTEVLYARAIPFLNDPQLGRYRKAMYLSALASFLLVFHNEASDLIMTAAFGDFGHDFSGAMLWLAPLGLAFFLRNRLIALIKIKVTSSNWLILRFRLFKKRIALCEVSARFPVDSRADLQCIVGGGFSASSSSEGDPRGSYIDIDVVDNEDDDFSEGGDI